MTDAPLRTSLQPQSVNDGLPSIVVDESRDLIRVLPKQFHSPAELSAHFDRLRAAIASIRRRGRQVRVIVDLRSASVLSPEGARVVQSINATLYRPDDRVALVIGSSLQRLQARRLFEHTDFRLFETVDAAEAWLTLAASPLAKAFEPSR